MNVLQLSKYYPPTKGGLELVAKMLSKAHCELGDNVSVVSFGVGFKNYSGDYGEKVYQINQDIFLISTPMNLTFWRKFRSMIEEDNIEKIYVHLPNPYMHELVRFNKSFLKKRGVVISAIYHSDIVNQKRLGPLYDWHFIRTMGLYDEFVCSSDKLRSSSTVLSRVEISKVRIVPFCIDEGNDFKQREKFSGNLLAIGRFVPYKGFSYLLDAVAGTNYKLTLIGDGPLKKELLGQISPNVTFVGNITHKEKIDLINKSDLLVVPSLNRSEAYGLIIVEAFENGLPVVASDIDSGVTFLVKDRERGLVFAPSDSKSIRSAVDWIAGHPSEYVQFSRNCRKFFEDQLSFNAFKNNISRLQRRVE